MNKLSAYVAAVVVSLLLVAAIVYHAATERYETVHIAGGFFATTDRLTGRVTVCRVSTVSPMECAPADSFRGVRADGRSTPRP